MKRKRMIKLLMGLGASRNDAVWAVNQCSGTLSHIDCYMYIISEYIRTIHKQLTKHIVEDDMTGAVAGIVGSAYG